ncbi:MAG: recombinase RecT [Holosporaceae bacterium]|jgi:recombination protein RecT|nr:recombinase RecT [Holosporaceae bacterium]
MRTESEALLKSPTALNRIKSALPNGDGAEKFLMLARLEISRNDHFRICKGETVLGCLIKAASLGLYVNTGDAYLVPYKDTCQLQIGYQGMLKLLYRCGMKFIKVNVVYSSDVFEFVDGSESMIKHIRAFGNRGEFMCAYCIAKFKEEQIIEIMDKSEIDFIMKKSKGIQRPDSPWNTFYDEMAKKTVIRRILKKMPQEKLDINAICALRDDDYFNREDCECEIDDNCIDVQKDDSKSEQIAEII